VLIVDDVITAGTAIREALDIIRGGGGIAGRHRHRARPPGTGA
jgi:orotate phosphoribosyltransferase